MTDNECSQDSENWKKFFKKHWNMLVFWIIAAILAAIGAILVYLWFVGDAQSSGMVPATLGQWTMEHMVIFILHLIFWEVLFVGVPIAIAAIVGWLWWKQIPEDERKEYKFFEGSHKTRDGGGAISFLFYIAFCIKIYIDGNWNTAIASWTLNYIVDSMISIIVWGAIIFGIPAIIIGLIWLSRETKKET